MTQKNSDGRSPATKTAATADAIGSSPRITPPCADGSTVRATAIMAGKRYDQQKRDHRKHRQIAPRNPAPHSRKQAKCKEPGSGTARRRHEERVEDDNGDPCRGQRPGEEDDGQKAKEKAKEWMLFGHDESRQGEWL